MRWLKGVVIVLIALVAVLLLGGFLLADSLLAPVIDTAISK